jgi:hypothetical protein
MGFGDTYDMEGNPCTAEEFMGLFRCNQLEVTKIKGLTVSTIYLGIDHGYGKEWPPLIFETMIFDQMQDGNGEVGCWRYRTKQAALDNHAEILRLIELGELP